MSATLKQRIASGKPFTLRHIATRAGTRLLIGARLSSVRTGPKAWLWR